MEEENVTRKSKYFITVTRREKMFLNSSEYVMILIFFQLKMVNNMGQINFMNTREENNRMSVSEKHCP